MKNLFKFCLLPLVLLITYSCTKTEQIATSNESSYSIEEFNNLELNETQVQSILDNSTEGYITFSSSEEYIAFLNFLQKESDGGLDLSENLKYKTYENQISLLYDELENILNHPKKSQEEL